MHTQPLLREPKDTSWSKFAIFFLFGGAMFIAGYFTHQHQSGEMVEASIGTHLIQKQTQLSLQPQPEVRLGNVVVTGQTGQAMVTSADFKGGLKNMANKIAGGWQKEWMHSTGSAYCWAGTAFNAARIAAYKVFDANGWQHKGTAVNNKKFRSLVARMKGIGFADSLDYCDEELWDNNQLDGENMMGVTSEFYTEKWCWGWGFSYKALNKMTLGSDSQLDCVGNTGITTLSNVMDQGKSVILGVTYGGDGPDIIHYLLLGGKLTIDNVDWYFILDPTPHGLDQHTDASLYPWKAHRLEVQGNRNHIRILGSYSNNYIVKYSVVVPTGLTSKNVAFDLCTEPQ